MWPKKNWEPALISNLLILFFALAIFHEFFLRNSTQWIGLAHSFLEGKLYFLTPPTPQLDSVFFAGHYYWPFGPLPAIFLMPFVWLSELLQLELRQGMVQSLVILGTGLGVFCAALRSNFSRLDAQYLTMAFCVGSPFVWIMFNPGWGYFEYGLSTFLLVLAVLEWLSKKRYGLIGFYGSLALATRITAGLAIIFFALDIITAEREFRLKWRQLAMLLAPFLLVSCLLLTYNFARFGNTFEFGYRLQTLTNPDLIANRNYGLLNVQHIPANLYYFLVHGPTPNFEPGTKILRFPFIKADPWGMSIFVTSPYLLYLFALRYNDRVSKILLATIAIILVPILLYYGIGVVQVGFRHALDFLPLLFLFFLRNYKNQYRSLSPLLKTTIVFSALLDIFFVFSLVYFY